MPGIISGLDIDGSLAAKNVVADVMTSAIELSNLNLLCAHVPVPELIGTVPVMKPAAVQEDVGEFESRPISGSAFTGVDFNLKKDRVFVASSDEAKYKSKKGDPLVLQKDSAGVSLANVLDKKIVKAFEMSPQIVPATTPWSTPTNNPLIDLATAKNKMLPYKADFVVMSDAVNTAYLQNDFLETTAAYAPAQVAGSVARIPGVDLDIYINSNVAENSLIMGASTGAPAAIGTGPVKVRTWDEGPLGAELYQMDVFRQATGPVMKTDADLNMSVCQITNIIA